MKNFKRIDEETIKVDDVYYTTNISKKIELKGESGYTIHSVRLNCVYYYPFKEEKK